MREYKLNLFKLTRAIKAEKSKTNGHETRAGCVCMYVCVCVCVYTHTQSKDLFFRDMSL